MDLKDSLLEFDLIAKAFDQLGIEYQLGGSVASSAYGFPRGTQDVDVEVRMSLEQARPLVQLLEATHTIFEDIVLDAIEHSGVFNLISYETAMKIDVFIRKNEKYDEEAGKRRVHGILIDESVAPYWVNSVEDVILRKLQWYRLGNEVSEQKWKDVIGVLKAQQIRTDFNYLRHWAIELRISDLLERAFEESGLKSGLDSAK